MAGRLVSLALLLALTGQCSCARPHNRPESKRKIHRDIPVVKDPPVVHCNNTISGRWLIADSEGTVCQREQLSPDTSCCSTGTQFSCDTCDLKNQCCQEFEMCVSCCLSPQYNAASLALQQFRSTDRPETGHWDTAFDYCQGKCRTTSRSTVHENAYLSPYHHCFSQSGKPTTPSPPLPDLPTGVSVVWSTAGQSCRATCEAEGRTCSVGHFPALNDCNKLREHFACEAGCEPGDGPEVPTYVIPAAPKPQRPSICLIWSAEVSGGEMNCDAASSMRQRACPCSSNSPG